MSDHYVDVCEGHGVVLRQCRCPSKYKTLTKFPCPEGPQHDAAVIRHLRQKALQMARVIALAENA